jgi:uncharacterized membrane protein
MSAQSLPQGQRKIVTNVEIVCAIGFIFALIYLGVWINSMVFRARAELPLTSLVYLYLFGAGIFISERIRRRGYYERKIDTVSIANSVLCLQCIIVITSILVAFTWLFIPSHNFFNSQMQHFFVLNNMLSMIAPVVTLIVLVFVRNYIVGYETKLSRRMDEIEGRLSSGSEGAVNE